LQIIFFEIGKLYPAQRIDEAKPERQGKTENGYANLVADIEHAAVSLIHRFVKKENAEPGNGVDGDGNPEKTVQKSFVRQIIGKSRNGSIEFFVDYFVFFSFPEHLLFRFR
jgi:hypothetical protein